MIQPLLTITASMQTNNNQPIHALGWLFTIAGIFLLGSLLNGLRKGQLRQQFKSVPEFQEQYFGRVQTEEERQSSERDGGHPAMPVIAFLGSLGSLYLGLAFLGILPFFH